MYIVDSLSRHPINIGSFCAAFVVLPDRKWVLETGREYEVLIEVYDKNSHRLYPSDVSLFYYICSVMRKYIICLCF